MKCKSCKKEYDKQFEICPYCGKINISAKKRATSAGLAKDAVNSNHFAGNRISIIKKTIPNPLTEKKTSNKTALLIGGAAFVLIILIISVYFLLQPTNYLVQSVKQIEAGSVVDPLKLVVLNEKDKDKYNIAVKENLINVNIPGDYIVTYKVKGANIEREQKITFKVVDTAPPLINAKEAINTTVGKEFNILNLITATDIVDGAIDVNNIKIEGSVDTNTVGTYPLTLTVSDKAGNKATKTITVEVQKKGDPVAFFEKIISSWLSLGVVNPYYSSAICDRYIIHFYIYENQYHLYYYSTDAYGSPGPPNGGQGPLTFIEVNSSDTYAVATYEFVADSQGIPFVTEHRTIVIDLGVPADNKISVDLGDGYGMNEYKYIIPE